MPSSLNNPVVQVEYCGVCDYAGHCLKLAQMISERTPNAAVHCQKGRQGTLFSNITLTAILNHVKACKAVPFSNVCSFEVTVNNKKIYSKLQTMALPDYDEVTQVIEEVSQGSKPKEIKGQQPINCAVS